MPGEEEAPAPLPVEASTGGAAAPEPENASVGEDWASRYKYLLADFENFRRRIEREREMISRQALAVVLRELIPIYEAFGHARKAGERADAAIGKGFDLIEQEWRRFFQREGVTPVAVIGAPFAPEDEEAVAETSADPEHPDGTVVEIVQQGYRFPGGLIRPAKIVVARLAASGPESLTPRASREASP